MSGFFTLSAFYTRVFVELLIYINAILNKRLLLSKLSLLNAAVDCQNQKER